MKNLTKRIAGSAIALLAVAGLVALGTVSAQATATMGTMYGIDNGIGPLRTVSPINGSTTSGSAGNIAGLNNASGLTWAPDGTLAAAQWNSGTSKCELWTINPATGEGSKVSTFDLNGYFVLDDCWGIAYGLDGTLYYGVTERGTPDVYHLVTVNPVTGAIIDDAYASSATGGYNFVAADPNTGLIYFQASNAGVHQDLFSYDPSTGDVVDETNSATNLTYYYGAAVAPDGKVYLSTWGGLVYVNSWADFAGSPTNVGSTSGNMAGLTIQFDYPTPTPTPTVTPLPETGVDTTSFALLGGIALVAITAGSVTVAVRRRERIYTER